MSSLNKGQKEKTSPKLAFAYGTGEVAQQLSWYMINNYLTIFYTDVVGLTASAISFIMLIARVWDAINDPIMGNIADKTKTRWGKFRPYLMFAPPFLAIFNLLTFTVWPVQGTMKVILCLVCYVGTGMIYTILGTAHGAIVNVIAIDSQVRMNLSTARGIGSGIISIILSAVVMPMILFFGQSDVATGKGYFWTAVVLSLVMLPCFWIEAYFCKETYTERLHGAGSSSEQNKGNFFSNLKELAKNDQLLRIVISTLFGAICVTARMSLLAYYIIYVIGDYAMISLVFTTMTIAQLVGTFLIPVATKTFGKKNYMLILSGLMIAGFVGIFFFGAKSMPIMLVLSFMCGLCNSSGALSYGMVSDCIEYGAWKLGKRQEGLAASFLSLAVKCSTAICGVAGVQALALVGYVPNAVQTPSAITGINFVVNIIPAICGVLSVLPLFGYSLTEKRVAEIRADLEARGE